MRKQRPRKVSNIYSVLERPSYPDFKPQALNLYTPNTFLRGLWRGLNEQRQRTFSAHSISAEPSGLLFVNYLLSEWMDTPLSFTISSSYLTLQPLNRSDLCVCIWQQQLSTCHTDPTRLGISLVKCSECQGWDWTSLSENNFKCTFVCPSTIHLPFFVTYP